MPLNRILILGSAGQIGSALSSFLINEGYEVTGYDLVNSLDQDLRQYPNDHLKKLIAENDFIFFLAFDVGGSHYLEKYQDTFEFGFNNLSIMKNTFEVLYEFKKPFVFASSQMARMNYSTYGVLKQLGEKMTEAVGGRSVHFWNVYGYETDARKFHVVSDFISQALISKEIRMRTTGEESRDFLHVEDCSRALQIVMEEFYRLPKNMPIHICSGDFIKIKEIAEIISHSLDAKVIPGEKLDTVQKDAKNSPNLEFRKYWQPKISVNDGIYKVVSEWKYQKSLGMD
jgi:nucleoside-diphosphate-sugar epimerase